jgi:hypothetical protein
VPLEVPTFVVLEASDRPAAALHVLEHVTLELDATDELLLHLHPAIEPAS